MNKKNTPTKQYSKLNEAVVEQADSKDQELLVVENLSVAFIQYEKGLKQRNKLFLL